MLKIASSMLLIVFSLPACAGGNDAIAAGFPGVRWVKSASTMADFDGDGRKDRFAMGVIGEKVVAALKLARQVKPLRIEFAAKGFECSPATFVDACGVPRPKLSVTSIAKKDFADMKMVYDLDSTDIFVQNGKSEGVSVPIDETDPFFFFWNAKTKRLDWLRL